MLAGRVISHFSSKRKNIYFSYREDFLRLCWPLWCVNEPWNLSHRTFFFFFLGLFWCFFKFSDINTKIIHFLYQFTCSHAAKMLYGETHGKSNTVTPSETGYFLSWYFLEYVCALWLLKSMLYIVWMCVVLMQCNANVLHQLSIATIYFLFWCHHYPLQYLM